MSTAEKQEIYAYGRNRVFTQDEYDALMDELTAAMDRDDEETIDKLIPQIPMDADVLMAFGSVYGKKFMLECEFDMTEAEMKYGEKWLDAFDF